MLSIILAATMFAMTPAAAPPASDTSPAISATDKQAERTALAWLKLLDKGEYVASWDEAGSMFQNAVTAKQWAAQAAPIRDPLGEVFSRTLASINLQSDLPGAPAGDYATLQFATDFANAQGLTETLILMKQDGSWKTVGYFVR